VIVGPWLWFTTTLGMCNFIAISALVFLVMYNQWKSFLIDPGSIPPGWVIRSGHLGIYNILSRRRLLFLWQCLRRLAFAKRWTGEIFDYRQGIVTNAKPLNHRGVITVASATGTFLDFETS